MSTQKNQDAVWRGQILHRSSRDGGQGFAFKIAGRHHESPFKKVILGENVFVLSFSVPIRSVFDAYICPPHHRIGLKCLAHIANCLRVHISRLRTLCVGMEAGDSCIYSFESEVEWCKCISRAVCMLALECVQLVVVLGTVDGPKTRRLSEFYRPQGCSFVQVSVYFMFELSCCCVVVQMWIRRTNFAAFSKRAT